MGAQSIHSPFVFELYREVITPQKAYYCFQHIEALRKVLLSDQSVLQVQDFGAKGKDGSIRERRVAEIARTSLKSKRYAQLIFRLVESKNPLNVLELGTSLGITTAYLACAAPNGHVVSLEGSSNIVHRAKAHLKKLQLDHKCEVISAPFSESLPGVLAKETFDVVFIDGHHEGRALKTYLRQIIPRLSKDALVIVDDIHWNADMADAWEVIKQWKEFSVTIDLFELGLLYNGPETPKQHFILRYLPWGF